MAQLSISEAIRRSGVGRTKFYKMIKDGVITPQQTTDGKKYIDASDLVRVFPDMGRQTSKDSSTDGLPDNSAQLENSALKTENRLLREQLQKAEQDKEWLKDQNTNLLLRIEPPAPEQPAPVKRENWFMRFWNAKDKP